MSPADKPRTPPVGLLVQRTARTLGRAFDAVLAEAGGSQPVWSILMTLKTSPGSTQRQLAEQLDIREATLTHHLNAMERDGLVVRQRDPANRRIHQVLLTEDGEGAFHRLRKAAMSFDRRLRSGMDEAELAALTASLHGLAERASTQDTR